MIEAVIFDMDGLLIDSEPLWEEVEKQVFKKVGISLNSEKAKETTGLRTDEVVEFRFQQQPWDTNKFSKSMIESNIMDGVIRLIKEKGTPKQGVTQIIEFFRQKEIPLALASSSSYNIIAAVLERLGLSDTFDLIYSAEEEPFGKPHPGVYISTCTTLGIFPQRVLTFEDSLNGVLSAKSAKLKCVAVPETHNRDNTKFAIADMVIPTLDAFGDQQWEQVNT